VGFYRSGFSPSSSLLPMGQAHKDLFPFTSEIAVRGGLLIKIDVQGAEAEVLKGGRRFLQSANAVLVEVSYLPLYDGQATIQEISGLLDDSGFAFMGIVDQYVRPADALPVYGDALFVRLWAIGGTGDSSACGDGFVPVADPSGAE